MATAERMTAPLEQPVEKGLKPGALGLVQARILQEANPHQGHADPHARSLVT